MRVIGAIATVGVIVGADVPMFLGAMVMGPLAAWLLKQLDVPAEKIKREGFEMLIDNFASASSAACMAVVGLQRHRPDRRRARHGAGNGVEWLVDPQPAAARLGLRRAREGAVPQQRDQPRRAHPLAIARRRHRQVDHVHGRDEPRPRPGHPDRRDALRPESLRPSVPGAIIIHFFGGIHEIYFPYILMKPKLIVAAIAGGAAGVLTAVLRRRPGGRRRPAASSPRDGAQRRGYSWCSRLVVATVVSFVVGALLLGFRRGKDLAEDAEVARKGPRRRRRRTRSVSRGTLVRA